MMMMLSLQTSNLSNGTTRVAAVFLPKYYVQTNFQAFPNTKSLWVKAEFSYDFRTIFLFHRSSILGSTVEIRMFRLVRLFGKRILNPGSGGIEKEQSH
ncbi:hypothetical protein EYC80_004742 [Monilinia laxa]|uniref:Uncharacterized protein n=1 Tax=Monilinia laxa TaxID=61186 RepID=A0A5N6KHX3_MONLA|nr:hypothetical protein EYC80_004742 [Monilinia laxa]